jgi:hypothetical protein
MHSRNPDAFHVSRKRYKPTGCGRLSSILAPLYHPGLVMSATLNQSSALPQLDLVAIAKTTRKTLDRLASFSRMRRYRCHCDHPFLVTYAIPQFLRTKSSSHQNLDQDYHFHPPNRLEYACSTNGISTSHRRDDPLRPRSKRLGVQCESRKYARAFGEGPGNCQIRHGWLSRCQTTDIQGT